MTPPSIFISYSHKDEDWKNRLETHLRVLEMQDYLNIWEDRKIEAGDDWYPEIEKALNNANIAVFLITANFLTSKFILGEEVPKLLERREKEGIRVIPVIVKPCAWARVKWLSKIQARPKDGRALSAGNEHQIDADLSALAEEIAKFIDRLNLQSNPNEIDINTTNQSFEKKTYALDKLNRLIDFGDYDKAIIECQILLDSNPEDSLLNIFYVIASLKGKGADRYQTATIKKLEKHLGNACDDKEYYFTALIIWGLIKYDHYKLNSYLQEKPTLDDIKKSLVGNYIEEINLDLIRKLKVSESAYEYFGINRFFEY